MSSSSGLLIVLTDLHLLSVLPLCCVNVCVCLIQYQSLLGHITVK